MADEKKDSMGFSHDNIEQHESEILEERGATTLMVNETYKAHEASVVRKLDMTLMPIIFILYLFNYLDRNNIAQAQLDSFSQDLNLQGSDYNTAVSILNIGYILMQLPSNMILTRLRPSLYIPTWVCIWSCVSATTAAAQNYGDLIAIRLILGICEAPFFPGVFYLLSCWYTRKELALRYAALYSGLVLATATSGLLAAAIFDGLEGVHGLSGWRWLFIIEGAVSLFLGLLAFLLLPDLPTSSMGSGRWLFSEEERLIAVDRLRRDTVSNQEDNESIRHGLKLAFTDMKVWVFALIMCSNQSAYGFNNFYPTIVEGFNLGNRTVTLACSAPPYIIGALVSYVIAWSSDRQKERGFHTSASVIVAMIGFILSVAVLNVPARYVASFLYISGVFGANAVVFSWAASTVNDTRQKKACAMALINIVSQLGSIWSPYFFDENSAPRYTRAMIILLAFSALEAILCLAMKAILRHDNKKLTAQANDSGARANLYTL